MRYSRFFRHCSVTRQRDTITESRSSFNTENIFPLLRIRRGLQNESNIWFRKGFVSDRFIHVLLYEIGTEKPIVFELHPRTAPDCALCSTETGSDDLYFRLGEARVTISPSMTAKKDRLAHNVFHKIDYAWYSLYSPVQRGKCNG